VLALGAVPIEDGSPYLVLPVKDAAGTFVANAWIGKPGDSNFGTMAWVGGSVGDAARALLAQYTVYLATPSARVRNYIAFEIVNERVGAAVDTIHVSGPGLPAAGLVFTPSTSVNPRGNWIIRADEFNWFTFNSERCAQVDQPSSPIPDCAFDWSAVQTGSTYTLQALDAAGGVLDTITRNLPAKPLDADALFANRAALFPQFSAAGTPEFSVRNIYDAAGPFVFGKTVHLSWSAPTAPGAQMLYVAYNTNHLVSGDPNGAQTAVMQSVALYGNLPLPTSAEFTANDPNPLTWAWATLAAADFFGNRYEHEVGGGNPR